MIPHIMYIILYMLKLKTYASNSTKIQKTLSHLLSPPLTILHLSIYLPLYPPFPISLIHTLSSSSLYIYIILFTRSTLLPIYLILATPSPLPLTTHLPLNLCRNVTWSSAVGPTMVPSWIWPWPMSPVPLWTCPRTPRAENGSCWVSE